MEVAAWLWGITIVSAVVISVGFSIFKLTSSNQHKPATLVMLPLYLQPNTQPNFGSKLFLFLFGIGFLCFYGSLFLLFFIGPWLLVIIVGFTLFILKSTFQSWWIRNQNCRPMKSMIIWSALLIIICITASIDILL